MFILWQWYMPKYRICALVKIQQSGRCLLQLNVLPSQAILWFIKQQ